MFVRLQYSHIKLMLLSLSLRFPGATQPILAERQSEALQIVHMIASEADVGINYASNYAVRSKREFGFLLALIDSVSARRWSLSRKLLALVETMRRSIDVTLLLPQIWRYHCSECTRVKFWTLKRNVRELTGNCSAVRQRC